MSAESGAAEIARRQSVVTMLTDTLIQRAPANAVAGGHLALQNDITDLINAWEVLAETFQADAFTYSEGHAKRLLSTPLDPRNQSLSQDHRRFEAARSMRDVEPSVALKLRDPYGQSVRD